MAEISFESIFEARKAEQEETRKTVREAMASAVNSALVRGRNLKDIGEARSEVTRDNYSIYISEIMPSDRAWLLENHHFVVCEVDGRAYVQPVGLEELLEKQCAQDKEINGIVE